MFKKKIEAVREIFGSLFELEAVGEDGTRGWRDREIVDRYKSTRIEAIATPVKHPLILGESVVIQVRG